MIHSTEPISGVSQPEERAHEKDNFSNVEMPESVSQTASASHTTNVRRARWAVRSEVSSVPVASARVPPRQTTSGERDAVVSRIIAALVTSCCLIIGALTNTIFFGVAIFVCGVVIAVGWAMLLGLPSRTIPKYPLLIVLVVGILTALLSTPDASTFIVAGSLIVVFLAEMFRADGRSHLVEQVSGTYLGCIVVISLTMWIHVVPGKYGAEIVITAAVILAGVAIINAFETRSVTVLSILNGLVLGVVSSKALDLPMVFGILLGIGAVLAYRLTARSVRNLPRPSLAIPGATRALIPFCALGVISFVLQEILT